jgi:hypothetical protein
MAAVKVKSRIDKGFRAHEVTTDFEGLQRERSSSGAKRLERI